MDQATVDEVVGLLKQHARQARAARIPYADVSSEHHQLFSRALKNVLLTELAVFTYAQIIDGLPTADVAYERRSPGLFGDHPIEDHPELCPGALNRARDFRENFDVSVLSFDPNLIRSYSRTTPGSQAFSVRLIELVATALHEIGVILFQLDIRLHQGDIGAITNWVMEENDEVLLRPTLFNHPYYLDHDVYPDGVADVVGYWAEDRILGGVTTLDRRAEASGAFPNVYLIPCRARTTSRYWQLHDEQQRALVDFFVAENTDSVKCPLPMLCTGANTERISEEFAMVGQVYRDIWERKPCTQEYIDFKGRRPQEAIDYPDTMELMASLQRQFGDD